MMEGPASMGGMGGTIDLPGGAGGTFNPGPSLGSQMGDMLGGMNQLISSPGQTIGGKVGGYFGNEQLGGQLGQVVDIMGSKKQEGSQMPTPMPPSPGQMLMPPPSKGLPGVGGQQGFKYDQASGRLVYG
jgi:hypothetical protein